MKLDAYRSCSFSEKREVLGTFWSAKTASSERIQEGAVQYGPWAFLMLIVIAVELAVVLVVAVANGHPAGWFALLPGVLVAFGIWRCVERMKAL